MSMESGFRFSEEPRMHMSDASQQYAERLLQLLVEEAIEDFERIRAERPDLHQFMTLSNLARATQAFKDIGKILKKYPRLLDELAIKYKQYPQEVVMAVLPDDNLVFTQTQEGVAGFAPVLGCTLYAIDDLRERISDQEKPYGFITSNNALIPYVLKQSELHTRPVISYKRNEMNPEDYLALDACGIFSNSTFHFRIDPTGNIRR